MRFAALSALPFILLLSGCQTFVQNVYDEQAEQECYDLPGIEAQRACLNELERDRLERN
ncbi:MAG: hypothetical protein NXI12_08860 [Alphaproteobacteria bacterium]|nr:hypothetical protein [Alphaproteobacteria bacterium]